MARTTQSVSRPAAKTAAKARSIPGAKKAATKPVARSAAKPAAAVQSKQDLRDRIDKLERANINLRAKNREMTEAAREAAERIDTLEEEVAKLRAAATATASPAKAATPAKSAAAKPAAPKPAAARPDPVAAPATAPKRRRPLTAASDRDPGDAVPPGVAALDPEPMGQEAAAAKQSLEEHLTPD